MNRGNSHDLTNGGVCDGRAGRNSRGGVRNQNVTGSIRAYSNSPNRTAAE
jgi:hypothetical protein